MYTADFLLELRRKAIRRRVWYTSLDRVDRGIIYLVTRVVDRVESATLGIVLMKITKKLRDAMKSSFIKLMESDGVRMARNMAEMAVEWEYWAAKEWARDLGYVRYLTMLTLNKPSGWGS